MAVKTYNFNAGTCVVGGKIISGFGDNVGIKIMRNEPAFNLKMGVSGEGTRSKSNNRSGKIILSLMQSSSSNDDLSAFALADQVGGTGAVPFFYKDNSGTSVATALTCWVQKLPDQEKGKEASINEWTLETDDIEILVGGNSS